MKTLNLNIATDWNQLTRRQIMFVARLFLAKLDFESFRLRAFLFLTGVRALPKKMVADQVYWIFKKGKQQFMLSRQELAGFLHTVDYLTGDCRLTTNQFPVFRLLFRRCFGPSNSCYNLSYIEFIHAEKCLHAFQRTNDVKCLNELCAILYRPGKKDFHPLRPDYNGDRRIPFNEYTYQRHANRFRLLSLRKRFAVYLFYTGCRNHLMDANSNLFRSGSVSSEPVNPVESLRKIVYDLNMGDITRNEKIYRMQVWEAFEHLGDLIENQSKKKANGKV